MCSMFYCTYKSIKSDQPNVQLQEGKESYAKSRNKTPNHLEVIQKSDCLFVTRKENHGPWETNKDHCPANSGVWKNYLQ